LNLTIPLTPSHAAFPKTHRAPSILLKGITITGIPNPQ
jgi:hypothetical protein